MWKIFSFDEISSRNLAHIILQEISIYVAAIQTDRSKSSSCKEDFVYVRGILASVQPKLAFFLVLSFVFIMLAVIFKY